MIACGRVSVHSTSEIVFAVIWINLKVRASWSGCRSIGLKPTMSVPFTLHYPVPPHTLRSWARKSQQIEALVPRSGQILPCSWNCPRLLFLFLCAGSSLWLLHLLHCSMRWPPQAALDGSTCLSVSARFPLFGITSQFSEEDSLIHSLSLSCGSPSGATMFSIRGWESGQTTP